MDIQSWILSLVDRDLGCCIFDNISIVIGTYWSVGPDVGVEAFLWTVENVQY